MADLVPLVLKLSCFVCQFLFFPSRSRRRWPAGTRACRTACVWATLPPSGMEPPSPNSGQTDTPSRTSSSEGVYRHKHILHFVCSVYENADNRLFSRVLGSKSESTHSGRTLRGSGSCWGSGNLPPWPRRLHPASNRTGARAGTMARRMKRKIINNGSITSHTQSFLNC